MGSMSVEELYTRGVIPFLPTFRLDGLHKVDIIKLLLKLVSFKTLLGSQGYFQVATKYFKVVL